MIGYYISAVIKGRYVEDKLFAVSSKQALYFFRKKHGFACRDLKIIGTDPYNEQLSFFA